MQTIILAPRGLRWLTGALCCQKEERVARCEKLGRRKVISFPVSDDQRIRCLEGVVSITGIGRRGDVILRQGTNILGGRDRIVIEALEESVIEISPA